MLLRRFSFGGYGGNLQPTPPQNPKPHGTAAKPTRSPPRTHLTLHGRARGTHTEPTGNPPGTQQEPAWQSERNPRGAYESPPGTHWEPTGNPPQTVSKTAQEPTSHPLVFIILFIRGKGDAVGPLLVLYNGCSSKGPGNSRKTFQTESRTQVGDRAGSLVGLLEL